MYISAGWNLAAARTKRGNGWSFNAISWFRDAALMQGSQNQRAYPHSTRGWGSFLITLGHWLDDEAFGYSIIDSKSLSHVAFLPWRDGASYSQATTTTSLSLSVLTSPCRLEDILSFNVTLWSFRLASDRSKRSHWVARYPHLVLMVKIECRNWLTIHIPCSRVTDDISIKNEALSPSARIAPADLAARSPLQFDARASKDILLGSKHDWAHSRRLVDRLFSALGWIKALTPPFKPGVFRWFSAVSRVLFRHPSWCLASWQGSNSSGPAECAFCWITFVWIKHSI